MNILPLLIIYAIGIIGFCLSIYIGWSMLLRHSFSLGRINWKIAVLLGCVTLPILLPCMYLTALDTLLWVNRELSLNISCFADMYGPANEILR